MIFVGLIQTLIYNYNFVSGNLGKSLDLIKSQKMVYTNINGEKESHSETKEERKY